MTAPNSQGPSPTDFSVCGPRTPQDEFSSFKLTVQVPSDVNSVTVPAEYLASLAADTPLKVEVGAIERRLNDSNESFGNQTFTEEDGFCNKQRLDHPYRRARGAHHSAAFQRFDAPIRRPACDALANDLRRGLATRLDQPDVSIGHRPGAVDES